MSGEILLVDDEANMLRTLQRILERSGYAVRAAASAEEALKLLGESIPDLMITDLKMPGMSGVELLQAAREKSPTLPVLVLTGHATVDTAVAAMKGGAFDYLLKPCNPDELLVTIERALEVRSLRSEVTHLRRAVERIGGFAGMVGTSPAIRQVFAMIQAVSKNRSNVLITGESGTGKELVARAIHGTDPARRERPFIAVNCGAFSPNLLESQLFGHRKGAFTGAASDRDGVFQAASSGTLFLDEVSEMPKDLQVKFLRAIEQREVTPLGSNVPVKVDVRLVTATNQDLEERVRKGDFREDLFFRLNVVAVALPPLRERLEDIPGMVEHFVKVLGEEYGIGPKVVAPEVIERFRGYSWPGNVRELRNVIERAFALSDEPRIAGEHLPAGFGAMALHSTAAAPAAKAPIDDGAAGAPAGAQSRAAPPPAEMSLEGLERRQIEEALRRASGRKNDAAKLLGISRKRLYRRLKKFGL